MALIFYYDNCLCRIEYGFTLRHNWRHVDVAFDGSGNWDGTSATEEKIKELTKATIRCIPLDNKKEEGKCILTGAPSSERVLFARAY